MVHDDEIGYVGAIVKKKEGELKYKNSEGTWVLKALYPYDHINSLKPKAICITEGPYDALWLAYHKIPAVCTLGVRNWRASKVTMLASLGAESVVLLGDNDEAGERFNDTVENDCEGTFNVFSFPYAEGDPGSMKLKTLKRLKKFMKKVR